MSKGQVISEGTYGTFQQLFDGLHFFTYEVRYSVSYQLINHLRLTKPRHRRCQQQPTQNSLVIYDVDSSSSCLLIVLLLSLSYLTVHNCPSVTCCKLQFQSCPHHIMMNRFSYKAINFLREINFVQVN